MSSTSALWATALLMGLVGGPHCIAMCGSACVAVGQASKPRSKQALLGFHAGRWLGYSAMGALAAASMQGIGWLSTQSAALRPAWTLLHVAAVALGVVLMVQARQPAWLESGARQVWAWTRRRLQAQPAAVGAVSLRGLGVAAQSSEGSAALAASAAPAALGMAWALMPCGLLYAALLVAGLSSSVWAGAGVMALFALGTTVSLALGPWVWLRLLHRAGSARQPSYRDWGVRLAGLSLAATAGWGLWSGLVHQTAPWCVVAPI